jgi:hypothetical protein
VFSVSQCFMTLQVLRESRYQAGMAWPRGFRSVGAVGLWQSVGPLDITGESHTESPSRPSGYCVVDGSPPVDQIPRLRDHTKRMA